MSTAAMKPNCSSRFPLTYTVHNEVHGNLEHAHLPFRSFLHPHFFIAWQTLAIGLLFVQCTDNVPSDPFFQPQLFKFGTVACAINDYPQMYLALYDAE